MARRIRKIQANCPKCGHSQAEPVDFISTLCQGCGETFSRVPSPARISRFSPGKLFKRPPRIVHCYRCGQEHEVSPHAHTTLCPRCNSHIQLEDVTVDTHVSRNVDMRGHLKISPEGTLNATSVCCSRATVQGRISGLVICEKTISLHTSGRCLARIEAQTVVIERGADLEFYFPVLADELIIRGKIRAVAQCSGVIRIQKSGHLSGEARCRSFQVEKGGVFQGRLIVNAREISMEKLHSLQEEFPFLSLGQRVRSMNPDYTGS